MSASPAATRGDGHRLVGWRTLWGEHLDGARLPPFLLLAVVLATLLVWLVSLFDLGRAPFVSPADRWLLQGLLAWTAALVAGFLTLLAISRALILRRRPERDPAVALLVIALPFVALFDGLNAFLILFSPVLAEGGAAPPSVLVTWTASRVFLSAALAIGALIMASQGPDDRSRRRLAPILALGLGALVFVVLSITGSLETPALHRLDALVPRPFDLVALIFFAVAGLMILPRLHRTRPSVLSHALIVSTIPQVLCQVEAAFGTSAAFFDQRMLAVHLLRLVAYATLLCGMVVDYVVRQRSEQTISLEFESTRRELSKQTEELQRVDRELVLQASKRRRAERSLRMLEQAVTTMSIGVTITDLEGKILYVNPAGAQMFGYDVDELYGQDARLVAAHEPARLDLEAWRSHQPWAREILAAARDGERFPVRLVADAVRDESDEIIALVTSCEDITERKRIDQMKHDFLSTVSHELRTPLTSIIASLGLLESSELREDPGHRDELLAVANRNSQRLLQLINDLLDLQKLSAGKKIALDIVPLDAGVALEEALAGIRAFADELEIPLELGDSTSIAVLADRRRLVQVLLNLLSNAIKFSPGGQPVETGARAEDGKVVLYVADRGPGIPEAFRQQLFEKFSQADGSSRRASGGSGLGLTIARELAEAMGGKISFETEVGTGTTFYVHLPAA